LRARCALRLGVSNCRTSTAFVVVIGRWKDCTQQIRHGAVIASVMVAGQQSRLGGWFGSIRQQRSGSRKIAKT
jgi:hypothetical protein